MQRRILYIFIFSSYLIQSAYSQVFARPSEWKKYRREITVQMGASGFLGDLGGLNKIGTDFSPIDLEFVLTKPAFSVGYRYKFTKNLNVHGSFNYLLVAGDDKLTSEPYRNNRNLNFKSNIFELAFRAELSLFKSKVGNRYGIKKTLTKRRKNGADEFIVFLGIGGFYFNPKGKNPTTGQWEKLYPLHTEGQGLPGGPKQYSRFALSIPVGIAYKKTINKFLCVGLEFNYRKTFTDYIDDVSTTYYPDRAAQLEAYGPKSVVMSDPSLGTIPTATSPNADGTGAQRGDKEKDTYMSVQVTVGYYFPSNTKKTRLRSKF